jgi:general secretion pathway protein N
MDVRRQGSFVVAFLLLSSLARAADPSSDADTVANPLERQTLGQLSTTRERPLFSPTRRPPAKPVAPVVSRSEPPPPPPPPPSVVVLGIVSEDGDGRAAIRSGDKSAGGKVMRVRVGDAVAGWKVERIEPRRLFLTSGDRSVDFALFSAKPAKSADSAVSDRRPRQVR